MHSWTLLSDTIYACQDREFDLKVGVMSTAILFGTWITPILFTFGTVLVVMLTVVGVLNEQSPIYFVVGVGGAAAQLLWQAATLDLTDPRSCKRQYPRLLLFDAGSGLVLTMKCVQATSLGMDSWGGFRV